MQKRMDVVRLQHLGGEDVAVSADEVSEEEEAG